MKITLFNSKKGFLLGAIAFFISALLAVCMPFLLRGASVSFLLGAIIFFGIPLVSFPYIKKKCLTEALLFFNETGLELKEINQENIAVINWDEISDCRIQPFQNLSGSGFVLKIKCKDGSTLKMQVIGEGIGNLDNLTEDKSIVFKLCRSVNQYNKLQVNADNKIVLLPSFFASKIGAYLLGFLLYYYCLI